MAHKQLVDSFGRVIDYVRISITDRCNFRCVYCMSDDMQFIPKQQVLTLEEIYRLSKAFTDLGIKKIRLTGGEPLVRKGALNLISRIAKLPDLDELVLTTNGSLLASTASSLSEAGVSRINISLDTLNQKRFSRLTRNGDFDAVMQGIDKACEQSFDRIKLNAVIMKGQNEDEVLDLLDFAISKKIDISYIEEMPLGSISHHDREKSFYSSDDVCAQIRTRYDLVETLEKTAGPSRYFRMSEHPDTRVGLISPHSHNFCATCNRMRVTADGRMLLCLGNDNSVDIKRLMRSYPNGHQELVDAITKAVEKKPYQHHFHHDDHPQVVRFMNMTGG